jgi:hypothetical protein
MHLPLSIELALHDISSILEVTILLVPLSSVHQLAVFTTSSYTLSGFVSGHVQFSGQEDNVSLKTEVRFPYLYDTVMTYTLISVLVSFPSLWNKVILT